MSVLEALTKLVVGMSRFGDHLLSRKVSGVIVAALAFACGAGLACVLKREARPAPAAKSSAAPAVASNPCAETAPPTPVADAPVGHNPDHRGGPAPTPDGVTARRGTRMLWHVETPPDAELRVVGSKVYAVTRTRDRILLKELDVPQH